MSPRDFDVNEGEQRRLANIERTQAQKASAAFLALLRKYHPEHETPRHRVDATGGH